MTNAQVLIVEDEVIVAESIRTRLLSLGYAVSAIASSGQEAIQKAAETHPDLVLMDIKLEGDMDGVEAAEQIHARFDIPVVYLTAYADDDTLQRAKITEPFGYILKPFEVRELQTAIEMALYKHKMERKLKESERWLATTLRSIGDAVIATDAKGCIKFMNPVAEALTGWKQEEALGRDLTKVFNIIDEERHKVTETPATKAIREGAVLGLANHTLIPRDGTEIPVDDSAAPIRDDKGNVTGAVLVFRDITERKRTEEVLRESEEKYRALTEEAPIGLCNVDIKGKVTYVNKRFEEVSGYSREEVVGKNGFELGMFSDQTLKLLAERMESRLRGEPARRLETRFKCKDGRWIWVEIEGRIIEKQEGPVGIQIVSRDITERKRAEEALRESTEYYNSIIESIPSSLLTIDSKLRVVSANRNFLQKARRSESETIGRRINEVFSPAVLSSSRLEERITAVFETGRPFRGGEMERLPGLFGRVYFYRVSPLKDERGEVENAVLLMDDVTEQKRLSEEVRRAEQHLASVVDSAYDLVASMDPEGGILTWNKAAERTSGFKLEQVKGQHLPDLCVEESRQEMEAWLTQLARGRFTKKSVETILSTEKGKEVPISWAGSRMLGDERRIVGLVAVGRDLTERKRLEAQLIRSAKLTSLGVMAGGIAHEIRNPLAISSAAAQLLLERPDDEQFRQAAAERIHSGIQRASYIIENLLKFARPPEERMVPMDINRALNETLSLLANQLRVQQIELGKDFASDLPPVDGNKSLLQQVFSNIILNACNAMPDGGSLTITTRANSANQVAVEFADTGCGIPKENLSKTFDPFFTTMPVGKGTGLGLSISYSIVKQHQGAIDVKSKVGVGTTFTVRLPGPRQAQSDAQSSRAMDEKEDASV